ncbi:MAG: hypothetical protein PSX81_02755 [bacterium]|nr:hypothetical protein [bacterium]
MSVIKFPYIAGIMSSRSRRHAKTVAFVNAANITNTNLITAIDTFFITIDSVINKCEYIKFDITDLTGGTNSQRLSQMKWNAVNPVDSDSAYRSIYINAPLANTNGITFDGISQYENTKCTPSNCTRITSAVTSLMRSNKWISGYGSIQGGAVGTGNCCTVLSEVWGGDYNLFGINTDGQGAVAYQAADGISKNSLTTAYRLTYGANIIRRNNVFIISIGRQSNGNLTNQALYRGCWNNLGTEAGFANCRMSGEIFGAFASISEISLVENALNDFNKEVELIFGLTVGTRSNY